jgi:hypothetical protein
MFPQPGHKTDESVIKVPLTPVKTGLDSFISLKYSRIFYSHAEDFHLKREASTVPSFSAQLSNEPNKGWYSIGLG